jgi:hypothetical protein
MLHRTSGMDVFETTYATEGKIPLGRPRLRWEENMKTDPGKQRVRIRIRFIWLRTETNGGFL